MAAVVVIANIILFGALMFHGALSAGMPLAIWAMLIGGCVGGVWIALMTSIPPITTSIDSPTGAVLVSLSASVGSGVIAAGGTPQAAIESVMLVFSASTLLSGALYFGLGALRCGHYFRFVPYFVVGGFLAATGWFLVAGGVRMVTGHPLTPEIFSVPWSASDSVKLTAAVSVFLVLLGIRRWVKWSFAMPCALVVLWVTGRLTLRVLGLSGSEHGWYLPAFGVLFSWSPFGAMRESSMTWSSFTGLLPSMLAVTIVGLISMVAKISSIEVVRKTSGDLDTELRGHGIGNMTAAFFGGIVSAMGNGSSRLLEFAGGATRISGVMCSLVLGAVALASFDLPGLVPIPVVAGLVFYLGYTFIVDALWRSLSRRAWLDLFLAITIMVVCVQRGYVFGVLAGLISACVLFAINYARFGVVRRHMTRSTFASHVDRSTVASHYLREHGDAIQLYWLSGYVFFGSSEGLFERIRGDIQALPSRRAAYVLLDFGAVPGVDSAAVVSFSKLCTYCDKQGVMVAFCALSTANHAVVEAAGIIGDKSKHKAFADMSLALGWCEDDLLTKANVDSDTSIAGFTPWIQGQLGPDVDIADVMSYLEFHETKGSELIYRQGDPADRIEFVAAGNLVVHITMDDGERLEVRRITTHLVVGEMGFFRHAQRSASVSSDGPASLYMLTRANFERMRSERPDLAGAFDDFIIRLLADRIDFFNRSVAALSV